MEGVMMKNMDQYAVAVRKPNHEIEVMTDEYQSYCKRYKILSLPILRGVVTFAESLYIGMKTLMYSGTFYEEEEEEPGAFERWLTKVFGDRLEGVIMGCTLVISVILSVAIFMLLPFYLSEQLKSVIASAHIRTVLEGLIRVGIFLLYVWAISKMSDIQRVYMYHGAEHKTINCLEAGDPLTPENVSRHTRLHKRCGTSFMLIVMVISIFVFMLIRTDVLWQKFLFRIVLVPVVAGVSYEFIRLAGRSKNRIVCALSKPGLSLQYLTTREPDLEMIEVAIASVDAIFDWKAYQEAMRNGEIED